MPSVSAKQAAFMRAASHNPGFAKKAGIPLSVASEFYRADRRRSGRLEGHQRYKGKERRSR